MIRLALARFVLDFLFSHGCKIRLFMTSSNSNIISHFIYVFFWLSGKWFVLPMLFVFEDENKLSKSVICQFSFNVLRVLKRICIYTLSWCFFGKSVNVHGIRMKCIQIQS